MAKLLSTEATKKGEKITKTAGLLQEGKGSRMDVNRFVYKITDEK